MFCDLVLPLITPVSIVLSLLCVDFGTGGGQSCLLLWCHIRRDCPYPKASEEKSKKISYYFSSDSTQLRELLNQGALSYRNLSSLSSTSWKNHIMPVLGLGACVCALPERIRLLFFLPIFFFLFSPTSPVR